jgi:hypothetical protein
MRSSRSSVTVGACIGFAIAVALQAHAAEPSSPPKPREGRGFMFGVGLGPSQMRFSGAEDLALVIGGPTQTITLPHGGGTLELRSGEIVSRTLVPPGTTGVVPFPASQNGAALSLQFGWSFSRRFAVLLDFDVGGGWDNSFNHLIGGPQLRYSPSSRLWIEAGYASGELAYGFSKSVAHIPDTGGGIFVAAGVPLVRKAMWMLDLQARSGTLWYKQFRATNLSVQLGIIRRRS